MGGDHTFLRSSKYCQSANLPLLGINTYKSSGVLHSNTVDYSTRQEDTERIASALEDESTHSTCLKARIRLDLTRILNWKDDEGSHHSEVKRIVQFITNEAFVAEKDVASASRYRIVPDGKDLGMFKSSGLLVSSGVGSSGWLYAARQLQGSKIS
jgi:hypothetical protein